jgi:hypothetical protein
MQLNTYLTRPPVQLIDVDSFTAIGRISDTIVGDVGTVEVTINGETRRLKAIKYGGWHEWIELQEPVHGKRLRGKRFYDFRLRRAISCPWDEIRAWTGYPPYGVTYEIVGFGFGAGTGVKPDKQDKPKGSHLRLVV